MEVMLAKSEIPKKFIPNEWYYEIKYDGSRCLLIRDGDNIQLISRSGKNDFAEHFPELVEQIRSFPHTKYILDCELVFFDGENDKYGTFVTALATDEVKSKYTYKLLVFDILQHNDLDLFTSKYTTRKQYLYKFMNSIDGFRSDNVVYVPSRIVEGDPVELASFYIEDGAEGIVLKKADGIYECGKRKWIKIKDKDTVDVYVIGLTKGSGKRASTFGSILLAEKADDGELTFKGKCSGFSDVELEFIYKTIMDMDDAVYPDLDLPTNSIKVVAPTMMVEVEYMELTEDGMFRHPRFIRIRDDK